MPQNQMPYTGDFTNGASWRSMQLYHLAIEKVRHDSFIFDIILSISKSAFGFRSLIFPWLQYHSVILTMKNPASM
jgi:hypothetical protein